MLGLARVQRGRDVGLRPLEHDERFGVAARLAPHRVRTCDVGAQDARAAGRIGVEQERDRVRLQQARAVLRDQQAERVRTHELVKHLGAALFEVGRQVHG
jgi:hypothetical protein